MGKKSIKEKDEKKTMPIAIVDQLFRFLPRKAPWKQIYLKKVQ